jgi:serine/threonine protein kinase
MDEPDDKQQPDKKPSRPGREISNVNLFADDIVFSDTEKILFEEDLKDSTPVGRDGLMDGNPEKRYTPVKKLNEGGMKAIWEVDDHRTARKVAMALIQEGKIASAEDIDAFLYEARLTSNLQHPNIIPIYDIALDENGNPYFTMKSLKGETLGEILKKLQDGDSIYRKKYTRIHLLSIFLKVCNAIDYAHTKGVIHLDLKPSNVIVGDFGDVQVLDWGLSALITHLGEYEEEPASWHSMDNVSLEDGQTLTHYLEAGSKDRKKRNVVGGTPGYMAPEQAQGSLTDIDFQTDVYTLGALLYEILTYRCPIEGKGIKDVLQKTVRGEFPSTMKCAPEQHIPAALDAITMKAMATDPADRYATVSVLIRDLYQFQEGFATIAEHPTFITHVILLVKRHKMAVGLIAASVAVISGVLANSFFEIKRSENVALEALASLQEKNEYIEATARQVAPDYLNLMIRAEREFAFSTAEQALDTGLAFDPLLAEAWLNKGLILLSQQRFEEAWTILSGNHGYPVVKNPPAIRLAYKYKATHSISDADLPQLVEDFVTHGLTDNVPRLFYHLNQNAFDPESRLPAITKSLEILNPKISEIHIMWQPLGRGGWLLDLSGNPELDDISPLCGLKILILNASKTGTLDLNLLTEVGLMELRLSGARINHLPSRDEFLNLQVMDLSNTRVRDISNILQFPKLRTLDISGIEDLTISPQLLWSQNLQLLTVSRPFQNDPTVLALQRRGIVIIYTDE